MWLRLMHPTVACTTSTKRMASWMGMVAGRGRMTSSGRKLVAVAAANMATAAVSPSAHALQAGAAREWVLGRLCTAMRAAPPRMPHGEAVYPALVRSASSNAASAAHLGSRSAGGQALTGRPHRAGLQPESRQT